MIAQFFDRAEHATHEGIPQRSHVLQSFALIESKTLSAVNALLLEDMAAVEIVSNLDKHFGRHAPNPGARGPCRAAINDDEALCGLAHFATRRETGRSCP